MGTLRIVWNRHATSFTFWKDDQPAETVTDFPLRIGNSGDLIQFLNNFSVLITFWFCFYNQTFNF